MLQQSTQNGDVEGSVSRHFLSIPCYANCVFRRRQCQEVDLTVRQQRLRPTPAFEAELEAEGGEGVGVGDV